ncbi:PDGF- and VEGF-receptor related isoform X5 [Musca autumnalis]|uniref:PDGF- and VEGF-receptor related isoform X5 n=1 Tax=Musca autumnalis TaxID=221902 RepID=UPI003CF9ADB7
MNLPRHLRPPKSRRVPSLHKMDLPLLLLLGLWISNTIIGCTAMPHPKPQDASNHISKTNEMDYERNYAVELGAPLIIPLQDEITLEADTEFVLRCESNEDILWKNPLDSYAEEGKYLPDDPSRPFGRTLTLKFISHTSVGNYYCIKVSSVNVTNLFSIEDATLTDLANNNLASSIYVFVNDTANLLAPMPFPVVHVVQFQDAVIPCKPSMPDVDVLLTMPNGKTLASDSGVRYNPQLGFVIEVRGMEEHGYYTCRPKIPSPDNEEEYTSVETILAIQMDKDTITTTTLSSTGVMGLTDSNQLDNNLTTNFDTTTTLPIPNSTSITSTTITTTTNPVTITTLPSTVTNQKSVNVINSISSPRHYRRHRRSLPIDVNSPSQLTKNDGDGNNMLNIGDDPRLHDNHLGDGFIMTIIPRFTTTTTITSTTTDNSDYDEMISNSNESLDNSSENNSNESSKPVSRTIRDVETTTRRSSRKSLAKSSTPRPRTDKMERPNITSTSKHHALVGETFQLVCEIRTAHDVIVKINWNMPEGVDPERVTQTSRPTNRYTVNHTYTESVLTIKNAQLSDTGKYTCNVTDHSNNKNRDSYDMVIMEEGQSYINIDEPNGYYELASLANKTVQMAVLYKGYPHPTLQWFRPDGTEIPHGVSFNGKYNVTTLDDKTTLFIKNANLLDSGVYTVRAQNGNVRKEREFTVTVHDTPIVTIDDVYVHEGEKAHVQCRVKSHKKPIVTWVFEPCSIEPRWPSCNKNIIQDFNETSSRDGETFIDFIYDMHFIPPSPGIIYCTAAIPIESVVHRGKGKAHVLVRDIEENMTIYGINDTDIIALGDEVTITCAAVAYYFTDNLQWYNDKREPIAESNDIKISTSKSAYSYKKSLTFKKIRDNYQGIYECGAAHINDNNSEYKIINIIAHEPFSPQMTFTNLGNNIKLERKLGESLELRCESHAIPKATVTWYKDDVELTNISSEYVGHMAIPYLKPDDQGQYKCVVANRLGVIEQTVNVKITNIPGLTLGWICGIVLLLLILIGLVIYLYIRVKRERKLLRELKAAGLANFEEGAVEQINPALTLDEQADLLPYDRCFEFPRDKLKLGKQLGAGAFGVVLKAHAEGIRPEEKESVVAVKMVKRNANNEVMRALVSELKIMVHLGQHLNVVNLLGAVTKNIAKRELMVIVEFCRYGNVQNFLMRNRKRFINQINPHTGKIDPNITTQRFSDNFELDRSGLKYVNLSFSNHQYINHVNNMNNMNNYYSMNSRSDTDNDPRSGTRAGRPGSTGYISKSELYEGQINTCGTENTVMTTVPEDEDNIMSNNSVQPAWRSNYKPDSTEAMSITTMDLISWSYQVACGMEYLSSKKVLHGDLAARNILLCEDNIVKICDFGLARSMYKSDNYKKQGDAPLPIKWLALESLSDHIFSTYTDVWSFGIVMWELFSLAKVPYPEIDANQSLYLKLKDGYRMEKPPYANDDLYDIMLECWSTNPERRPLFNVLKERFGHMLGEEVASHYMDLNEPYLRVNTEYMKRNQTDYLALMGSPDEMAPPPPRYVNGHILPEIRIDLSSDDYLQMSPNGGSVIFSPTRPKDSPPICTEDNVDHPPTISTTSFNFPDTAAEQHSPTLANNLDSPNNAKPPRNKKDGIDPLPEEIPMLPAGNHHEDSPDQPRKYAQMLQQQTKNMPTPSPRHHIKETKLNGGGSEEGENYVNLKSPKKTINNNGSKHPEAFSNPSYQILKPGTEKIDVK